MIQQMKTEQTQILSQKMIQSAEILQMSSQELELYINELSLENPVVDMVTPKSNTDHSLEKYQWLNSLNEQNRYTYTASDPTEHPEDRDQWNFATDEETLQQYLWSQIISSDFSDMDNAILSYLLECLDDRGYLMESLDDLCVRFGIDIPHAETLLSTLQSLDPAGVFARNLGECLSLQLERIHAMTPALSQLITCHLDLLAKNQLPLIAKKIGCSLEDTIMYCQLIKELNPKPGANFSSREQLSYIIPDITVVKFEHQYDILLNDSLYPDIEINGYYRQLCNSPDSEEVQDYLQNKIRQVEWIKTCIAQRNKTLINIAQTLLLYQEDFFAKGPSCLKPLQLRDVAQTLNIHESTVSRATRKKHLQCLWGVYPMNYFFSKGVAGSSSLGSQTLTPYDVKKALVELVDGEDKKKPYSDRMLSEKLDMQGISISRRTVNKYRDELNIPDASGRKHFT